MPPTLTLEHRDNLITLCVVCHGGFDAEYPLWVMVPTIPILVTAARYGEILQRTLLHIDTSDAQYHRFLLEPGWIRENLHSYDDLMRTWSGEPTAAILKAVKSIAEVIEVEEVSVGGRVIHAAILESVRSKTMELV